MPQTAGLPLGGRGLRIVTTRATRAARLGRFRSDLRAVHLNGSAIWTASATLPAVPPDHSNAPLQTLFGVACVSAALLMTELALTRIFSVVMYYHFAFLAISVALFGLSASGVFAFVRRGQLDRQASGPLLASRALVFSACTIAALFVLVRLRVGLNY